MFKTKKGTIIKESDHNTLICNFRFIYNPHLKKHKTEMFNYKDAKGLAKFKSLTSRANKLSNIFDQKNNLNSATKKFIKTLNGICHQSFKKIRIKNIQNKEISSLFNRRRVLRTKDDSWSKKELGSVEDELAEKCAKQNYIKIREEIRDINCDEGGFNVAKFWKLKKNLCPRPQDPPTAMMDGDGNLVTSVKGVEKLSIEHYSKVLKNRPMIEKYSKLKEDKEDLCEERVKLAKGNVTPPWEMSDLETVLHYLKKNKTRDPLGLSNELFKPEVAEHDLKMAVLILMNRI